MTGFRPVDELQIVSGRWSRQLSCELLSWIEERMSFWLGDNSAPSCANYSVLLRSLTTLLYPYLYYSLSKVSKVVRIVRFYF